MRWTVSILAAALVLGCGRPKTQTATADTTAMLSLDQLAGTWSMRAMPETSDSTIATYQMVATADPTGWVLNLPDRYPIRLRVTVAGDSIITEAGPYESILRKGVAVVTRTVARLQDGKMVGTFMARYATRVTDSVLYGRVEGSRLP